LSFLNFSLNILKAHEKISDRQQSWGYEDGPWKGSGPLLLVAADFLIFFNPCFIGSVGFDDHLTDSSLARVSCLPQPALVVAVLQAYPKNCKKYLNS